MKLRTLIFLFWMIIFLQCDGKIQPYAENICVKSHTILVQQIILVNNSPVFNQIPVVICDLHEWRIVENDTVYKIKELEEIGPLE
ncbi:hypothetical protein LEP1GSC034_3873 [Leptospira interrogans str. 2003000735]|uniref:Uncharacterized protein n=2 Tax=Leptospira interrogans TaxID=173 RepID=A0A829D8A3_LEPIR|nr:hypothetical protein [Leptospira interrogans]EMY05350.1 hypothetical protein LEP1GSC029_3407 [Leptospira interrogans str. 2002000626]EMY24160.1 hypothetical protein LEP1GSC115_2908 [Leptospira interrogans serovar Australis str. 200703203]EKN88888.1 hypothetical protein LEP1GSC027_4222 [Leptospira interrogans str. 2002000624]EKQ36315.1 hypothetical protein LEP1GSC025_0745 [Leptospira interrogans str. 2002000621]EKQ47597.1 hypothetical protein LEP1GSC026_4653 [Leptospira interrogans str. 2002